MHIHTVSPSETVFGIARKYGVSPTKIIENNRLATPDRLTVGEELLILTPTKTYTVRNGDTLERIAKRFGISKNTILRNNPALFGSEEVYPEEILALKYDTPIHGIAVLNGYYYNGCPAERINFALPYINYLTVSGAVLTAGGIREIFDTEKVAEITKKSGKIPLYRIYDRRGASEICKAADEYIEILAVTAKGKGFSGITLAAHKATESPDFEDFLFKLKKRLLEDGLSLFLEIDANSSIRYTEIPDSQILLYEKCALPKIPDFTSGEELVLGEFANKADSSRTFIDISPFAYCDGEQITKSDAIAQARKDGREIKHDKESLVCYFDTERRKRDGKKSSRTIFEAMKNTKAKLDLAGELGYMGISFDIMRSATSDIMMMNSLFLCGGDFLPLI